MSEQAKRFIEQCNNFHTTVGVFIKLFNMWHNLSVKERGAIIDSEIEKGRLEVGR